MKFWEAIVRAITAPVGFYSLVVLSVSSLTGVVVSVPTGLESIHKLYIMAGAGFVVFFTVTYVTFIVAARPQNLVYSESAHLEESAMRWGAARNSGVSYERRSQGNLRIRDTTSQRGEEN